MIGKIRPGRGTDGAGACGVAQAPRWGRAGSTRKEDRRWWEKRSLALGRREVVRSIAITLGKFVDSDFYRNHVDLVKMSGRKHYDSMLKHVLPF